MSDKDVELKIGADGSQAEAEFGKVANSAEKAGQRIHQTVREASYNMASSTKAATEQMQDHFSKLADSFSKVNAVMMGFTAVLAGGAAFKAGIDESVKLTMEANKLGKQLGITATEASVLNVALDDVHVESETLLAANNKLTKTLGTNEMAFKHLGVATRDANGNFRSSLDIMLDVNTHLLKFKEGVDRNIEGQKIYGKQWGEVQGVLRLTTDRMEESRKKAEELGLVIGKENVAATANYRAAMNDVGDVISALNKSVGDILIPILTNLGNLFSNTGPAAVQVMRAAMQTFAETINGVIYAVRELGSLVGEVLGAIGNSVNMAFGGDSLSGMELFINMTKVVRVAIASLASSFAQFVEGVRVAMVALNYILVGNLTKVDAAFQESAARLEKMRADYKNTVDEIVNGGQITTPTTKKEGGAHSAGGEQKNGKSQIGEWKAELEARKEVEGQFFKTSLVEDEAFWQAKLAHVKKGSKDEVGVRHELFAIHKQMAQQQFAAEDEALKTELAAARTGSVERINLALDTANHVGATYGYESKEYLAAVKEQRKIAEEFEKEQQKLGDMRIDRAREHGVAMIGMERDRLGLKKSLGQVSDQEEIAELKALKEREYQIEVQAVRDKIALMHEEGPAKQQQLDELAKLQDKHNAEIARLDIKSVEAVKQSWTKALGAIDGAFEKSITGMIMGTQTLQKSMANIGQAILAEFVSMGVKRTTAWIANEAAMLAASRTKNAAVASGNAVGATSAITSKATEAGAVVGGNAAEGAAGAAASQAAIPIVGPGLAIAAFATTMAMILGARSMIKSSAGGEWQVPHDRLNIVHKDETILPAHVAGPLRNMVEGGGVGGGDTHLHIHAAVADVRGFESWLKNNSSVLAPALRDMNRKFIKI